VSCSGLRVNQYEIILFLMQLQYEYYIAIIQYYTGVHLPQGRLGMCLGDPPQTTKNGAPNLRKIKGFLKFVTQNYCYILTNLKIHANF